MPVMSVRPSFCPSVRAFAAEPRIGFRPKLEHIYGRKKPKFDEILKILSHKPVEITLYQYLHKILHSISLSIVCTYLDRPRDLKQIELG